MFNFFRKIKKINFKDRNDPNYYITRLKNGPFVFFYKILGLTKYYLIKFGLIGRKIKKLNIGSGTIIIKGYYNIDIYSEADLFLDLNKNLLPFKKNSIDTIVCISTINYFTKKRGQKIMEDIFRILKPGGIIRFGTQDLELIAKKYIDKDKNFFFQKNKNGEDRFEGETMGDKFNSWFYGYEIKKGCGCKYFYDFETLHLMLKKIGFKKIEKKKYLESDINEIEKIDNRSDQMFFLETIK